MTLEEHTEEINALTDDLLTAKVFDRKPQEHIRSAEGLLTAYKRTLYVVGEFMRENPDASIHMDVAEGLRHAAELHLRIAEVKVALSG